MHESFVPASVERVFAFHESPDALRRLIPPWERVDLVQPPASLRPGTRVVLRVRVGPIWTTWVAEHTAYERDVLFQDRMVKGPFSRWIHTHRFLREGASTRLRDEVEYGLPLGRLAEWLAGPAVERRLRRMFEHRHAVTRAAVADRNLDRGS